MKKFLIGLVLSLVVITAVQVQAEQIIQDEQAAHMLAGSFLDEHLKSKGCDPLLRYGIIFGLSVIKEALNDNPKLENVGFSTCGIAFSFTLTEIGDFLESHIDNSSVRVRMK